MFDIDLGPALFDFFWKYILYFSLGYFIPGLILLFIVSVLKLFKVSVSKILVLLFSWFPAIILSYFVTSFTDFTDQAFRDTVKNSIPVILILLAILFIFLLRQKSRSTARVILMIILISFIIGFDCASYRVSSEDRTNKKEQALKDEFTLQMSSLYKIISVQRINQTNGNFQIAYSVPRDGTYVISVFGYSPKDNIEKKYSVYGTESLLLAPDGSSSRRIFLKKGINNLVVSLKKEINPTSLTFLDLNLSVSPIINDRVYTKEISPISQLVEGINFCSSMIYQCSGYLFSIPEVQNAVLHIKLH